MDVRSRPRSRRPLRPGRQRAARRRAHSHQRPAHRRREGGGHLWAERFDRDLEDIFAVQDEVVGQIVEALVGQLAAQAAGREAGGRAWRPMTSASVGGSCTRNGRRGKEARHRSSRRSPSTGYAEAHAWLAGPTGWAGSTGSSRRIPTAGWRSTCAPRRCSRSERSLRAHGARLRAGIRGRVRGVGGAHGPALLWIRTTRIPTGCGPTFSSWRDGRWRPSRACRPCGSIRIRRLVLLGQG